MESAANAVRGEGARKAAANKEIDRAPPPRWLVQPAEAGEARQSQILGELTLLIFRVVLAHYSGDDVARHLPPAELLLDRAPRQRMVQKAIFHPQPGESPILNPPGLASMGQRAVNFFAREPRPLQAIACLSLGKRSTTKNLRQRGYGVTRLLRLRPPLWGA